MTNIQTTEQLTESSELKLAVRREVRRRISAMDAETKEAAARSIFSRIEQLPHFCDAKCIALFAAMKDEVPTAEALRRWSDMGKRIVVPRVEGDIMNFYRYSPEAMHEGAFGIDEPTGEELCSAGDIDLIIVPARAFTISGIRLGRGGGFYDKYMSLPDFRAHKTGIAFACQVFDSLPADTHDITVDEVVFA